MLHIVKHYYNLEHITLHLSNMYVNLTYEFRDINACMHAEEVVSWVGITMVTVASIA